MGLFDGEDDERQNMGLLGMMTGLGIMQANQPGASMGQAVGAGGLQGLQGMMQMRQMAQRDKQMKQTQAYQNAMLQQGQDRMVPNAIREYEYAKAQGFEGTFEDYRTQAMGRNEVPANVREWEYFSKLPEAAQAKYLTMRRGISPINLGDQYGVPNPAVPGQLMGSFPKGIPPEQEPVFKGAQARESAAGSVQGTTQATAAVNLAQTIAQGEEAIKLIDDIVNHPGMSDVVGAPGSFAGAVRSATGWSVPGTDTADFSARLDQIQGKQFLQAYETLKGSGQITEIEGAKAQDAISRMTKTGQTEAEFKKAAKEFQDIIRAGINRAKMKAGQPAGGATGGWSDNEGWSAKKVP